MEQISQGAYILFSTHELMLEDYKFHRFDKTDELQSPPKAAQLSSEPLDQSPEGSAGKTLPALAAAVPAAATPPAAMDSLEVWMVPSAFLSATCRPPGTGADRIGEEKDGRAVVFAQREATEVGVGPRVHRCRNGLRGETL